MKEIITTENAPAAVGTYSTAYKCGNMVFLSGQLGLDPVSGQNCLLLSKHSAVRLSATFLRLLKPPAVLLQISFARPFTSQT